MSEATAALPGTPTQAELEQIRRYTRRDFVPEELYVFPAVLCDNQIDRDGERFSRDCLRELAELFVGVTGVFDHRASAEGQHARIFAARVVEDPSRPTNCGEPYTALRAEIYMPRNEKTAGLIAEIDAGIKKEVSVSCAVSRSVCSVCGEPAGTCSHQRGKRYGEIPCHVIHCAATDAYEWSFVAVPAQPLAGVTKSVRQTHREAADPGDSDLLELGKAYLQRLREEYVRCSLIALPELPEEAARAQAMELSAQGLITHTRALQKAASRRMPVLSQLLGDLPSDPAPASDPDSVNRPFRLERSAQNYKEEFFHEHQSEWLWHRLCHPRGRRRPHRRRSRQDFRKPYRRCRRGRRSLHRSGTVCPGRPGPLPALGHLHRGLYRRRSHPGL